MLFPWTDLQFWLVTAIAAWCTWIVVRQLFPRQKSTVCGACASGAAACAKHASRDHERPGPAAEPPLVTLSPRRRP